MAKQSQTARGEHREILISTSVSEGEYATRGGAGRGRQSSVSVPVDLLAEGVRELCKDIDTILDAADQNLEAFSLDEVTVSLEISMEGKVSLLGIGGGAAGKGGITLKLKRKN